MCVVWTGLVVSDSMMKTGKGTNKKRDVSALELIRRSRVNAPPSQQVYDPYVGTLCPLPPHIVPKPPRKPSKTMVYTKTLLDLGDLDRKERMTLDVDLRPKRIPKHQKIDDKKVQKKSIGWPQSLFEKEKEKKKENPATPVQKQGIKGSVAGKKGGNAAPVAQQQKIKESPTVGNVPPRQSRKRKAIGRLGGINWEKLRRVSLQPAAGNGKWGPPMKEVEPHLEVEICKGVTLGDISVKDFLKAKRKLSVNAQFDLMTDSRIWYEAMGGEPYYIRLAANIHMRKQIAEGVENLALWRELMEVELAQEIQEEYRKMWPLEEAVGQQGDEMMESPDPVETSEDKEAKKNENKNISVKEEAVGKAGPVLACDFSEVKEEPREMELVAPITEEPREMELVAPSVDVGIDDLPGLEQLEELFKEIDDPELFSDIPEDLQRRVSGLLPWRDQVKLWLSNRSLAGRSTGVLGQGWLEDMQKKHEEGERLQELERQRMEREWRKKEEERIRQEQEEREDREEEWRDQQVRKAFKAFEEENLDRITGDKISLASIAHRFKISAPALRQFWKDLEEDRRNDLDEEENGDGNPM